LCPKSFQLTYDYQLLGALAIAPNDQKLGIVSVHQQYLSVLAELEQESALQVRIVAGLICVIFHAGHLGGLYALSHDVASLRKYDS
jgi:hypothetical protein